MMKWTKNQYLIDELTEKIEEFNFFSSIIIIIWWMNLKNWNSIPNRIKVYKTRNKQKKRNEDQIQLGESGLLPNPSTTTTTKDWQTHGSSIHSLILIHCNICHLRFTSVKFSNVHHHHHHQWMMIANDFWRLTNKQLELARLKMLVSLFSRNVQTHQGKKNTCLMCTMCCWNSLMRKKSITEN